MYQMMLKSIAVAGLVFGMAGYASAQSCTDSKDCYDKKNNARQQVQTMAGQLQECVRPLPAAKRDTNQLTANFFLESIGARDKAEAAELKNAGNDTAKRTASYRSSLENFSSLIPMVEKPLKYYGCDGATTTTTATKPAPAPQPPAATKGILITGVKYGGNCPNPNASIQTRAMNDVAKTCDGKDSCSYAVNAGVIGDAAPGCAKSFEVTWTCDGKANTRTEAAEAHGKTVSLACATTVAQTSQPQQPQQTQQTQQASATGTCNIDMSKATAGWDCRQVAGGWEAKKDWPNFVHPCTTKEAMDAVIKKADVKTCSALVIQTGALIDVQVNAYKTPIIDAAKAANDQAAKNASLSSRTGTNQAFWKDFENKYKECGGTAYNMGRLKQWCEDGLKPAIVKLTTAISKCPAGAANCTIQ